MACSVVSEVELGHAVLLLDALPFEPDSRAVVFGFLPESYAVSGCGYVFRGAVYVGECTSVGALLLLSQEVGFGLGRLHV